MNLALRGVLTRVEVAPDDVKDGYGPRVREHVDERLRNSVQVNELRASGSVHERPLLVDAGVDLRALVELCELVDLPDGVAWYLDLEPLLLLRPTQLLTRLAHLDDDRPALVVVQQASHPSLVHQFDEIGVDHLALHRGPHAELLPESIRVHPRREAQLRVRVLLLAPRVEESGDLVVVLPVGHRPLDLVTVRIPDELRLLLPFPGLRAVVVTRDYSRFLVILPRLSLPRPHLAPVRQLAVLLPELPGVRALDRECLCLLGFVSVQRGEVGEDRGHVLARIRRRRDVTDVDVILAVLLLCLLPPPGLLLLLLLGRRRGDEVLELVVVEADVVRDPVASRHVAVHAPAPRERDPPSGGDPESSNHSPDRGRAGGDPGGTALGVRERDPSLDDRGRAGSGADGRARPRARRRALAASRHRRSPLQQPYAGAPARALLARCRGRGRGRDRRDCRHRYRSDQKRGSRPKTCLDSRVFGARCVRCAGLIH